MGIYYNGKINLEINLPERVDKNKILSERYIDLIEKEVIHTIMDKFDVDSMTHEAKLEEIDEEQAKKEFEEMLANQEPIEYEPIDADDIQLLPDYSDTTIKEIHDTVKEFYGGEDVQPVVYNAAYLILDLLDDDLDEFMKRFEDDFNNELTNRFLDIKIKINELMNCLK